MDARFLTELAVRIHANLGFYGDSTRNLRRLSVTRGGKASIERITDDIRRRAATR